MAKTAILVVLFCSTIDSLSNGIVARELPINQILCADNTQVPTF